jgi:hypothetical protein
VESIPSLASVSVFTDDGSNQHASIDACGRERS